MKRSEYRSLLGVLLAFGLTAGIARADQDSDSKQAGSNASKHSTAGDQKSQIKQAAQMNMTAIRVAELASQKAQNQQLKQFASTLRQDHQQAQQNLERIAQRQNVTLPTTLDAKCQEEISKLENLSGSEFDREFAKSAIEGHAKAIAHLQQQTSSGNRQASSSSSTSTSGQQEAIGSSAQSATGSSSSDWQQYNQRMLSKIKDHQRQAREVARAVGLDQSTITSLENSAREHVGSPGGSVESSERSDSASQGDNTSSRSDSSASDQKDK